jgi:hypothetical protein
MAQQQKVATRCRIIQLVGKTPQPSQGLERRRFAHLPGRKEEAKYARKQTPSSATNARDNMQQRTAKTSQLCDSEEEEKEPSLLFFHSLSLQLKKQRMINKKHRGLVQRHVLLVMVMSRQKRTGER